MHTSDNTPAGVPPCRRLSASEGPSTSHQYTTLNKFVNSTLRQDWPSTERSATRTTLAMRAGQSWQYNKLYREQQCQQLAKQHPQQHLACRIYTHHSLRLRTRRLFCSRQWCAKACIALGSASPLPRPHLVYIGLPATNGTQRRHRNAADCQRAVAGQAHLAVTTQKPASATSDGLHI